MYTWKLLGVCLEVSSLAKFVKALMSPGYEICLFFFSDAVWDFLIDILWSLCLYSESRLIFSTLSAIVKTNSFLTLQKALRESCIKIGTEFHIINIKYILLYLIRDHAIVEKIQCWDTNFSLMCCSDHKMGQCKILREERKRSLS